MDRGFRQRWAIARTCRYMFDRKLALGLRALSLFHVALPPTLFWAMRRLGCDRRTLAIQCGITSAVLPLSYALTDPEKNINWVFGPGSRPQKRVSPLLYLALAMLAFHYSFIGRPTY